MDLVISHVYKDFGRGPVLRDVSLTVRQGETVCLMGPSGLGKTTLLRCVAGLERPESGSVTGVPERLGYVFQEDRLCGVFSAVANVRLATGRALPEAERCCYAPPRLEAPGFAALDAGVYGEAFANMDALIFVGACGVAVRSIAPFVRDKKTDPAVLCLDERASFVIPLLSGHIGGANALAARLAGALGAAAVITTATDVNGKFAVDAWAAQNGCAIEDFALAKRFAAEILEHDLPLCSEFPVCPPLPGGVVAAEEGPFGVYIGCRTESPFGVTLRLIPRKLRVGLGCRRGTEQAAIETAVRQVFRENRLALAAISGVSSIDLKQDEPGLLAACRANGWQARFYSAAQLRAVPGSFTGSNFVASVTGVDNVCERAALYGGGRLLVQKQALGGVTVAVAEEPWEVRFG